MTEFHCPHCGQPIRVSKGGLPSPFSGAGSWDVMAPMTDSARRPRFGDVARPVPVSTGVPEFTEATRISSARPANKESDVDVPFYQTLITGGMAMVGTGLVVLATHGPAWVIPVVGGGAIVFTWAYLLIDHRSMLKVREHIKNEKPPSEDDRRPPPPVRIEYHEGNDQRDRTVFSDLPVPNKTKYAGLITFARAVALQGDSFSERTANEHGYTRDEWKALRDEFIKQKWASWNHPTEERQGVMLLRAGQMVLRKVAGQQMPRPEYKGE